MAFILHAYRTNMPGRRNKHTDRQYVSVNVNCLTLIVRRKILRLYF